MESTNHEEALKSLLLCRKEAANFAVEHEHHDGGDAALAVLEACREKGLGFRI